MSVLAAAWAHAGSAVTLITLASTRDDQYVLDAAIERVALGVTGSSANALQALAHNMQRIVALRRAIRACRPDVVVSFVTRTNVLTLLATWGMRIPVVVSERTSLPGERWVRGPWRRVYGPLYRRAAALVVQTQRGADALEAVIGRSAWVIPNPLPEPPVRVPAARVEASTCSHGHTLLAVGRLSPEKGFDQLIDAFARIADRHPDWNLKILGEGMMRGALTSRIAQRRLGARVALPGFDPNVREAMHRADLFVLSSSCEGFPNALLEAMAEGMPCVSFDCETGPRELIRNGENGWLVPAQDVTALAGALDAAMNDPELRARFGARAREVRNLYSLPRVIDRWNRVLRTLAPGADAAQVLQEGVP